jgi:hypothetical protein
LGSQLNHQYVCSQTGNGERDTYKAKAERLLKAGDMALFDVSSKVRSIFIATLNYRCRALIGHLITESLIVERERGVLGCRAFAKWNIQ